MQSRSEHRSDSRQRSNGRLVSSRSEFLRRRHWEVWQRFCRNSKGIRKRERWSLRWKDNESVCVFSLISYRGRVWKESSNTITCGKPRIVTWHNDVWNSPNRRTNSNKCSSLISSSRCFCFVLRSSRSLLATKPTNAWFLNGRRLKTNRVNHAEVSQINASILRQQKRAFLFLAASSAQWYQWSSAHPHTRLCTECWTYYKKSGGLKYPKKSGKKRLLKGSERSSVNLFIFVQDQTDDKVWRCVLMTSSS